MHNKNTTVLLLLTAIIFATTAFLYEIISPKALARLEGDFSTTEEPEAVLIPVDTAGGRPAPTQSIPVSSTPQPPTLEPVMPPTAGSYTLAEVALHNSTSDCWTAIGGLVYDLTPYVEKHPGGVSNITRVCGKDGTSAFGNQHGGESKPENVLAGYQIGTLR